MYRMNFFYLRLPMIWPGAGNLLRASSNNCRVTPLGVYTTVTPILATVWQQLEIEIPLIGHIIFCLYTIFLHVTVTFLQLLDKKGNS